MITLNKCSRYFVKKEVNTILLCLMSHTLMIFVGLGVHHFIYTNLHFLLFDAYNLIGV